MSNSTKLANPMKVITGKDTRWSYANVWEAKSINGGTPKFSVSLIIPKTDTVTVQKIKAAIQAAYEEGQAKLKGNGRTVPPLTAIKTPLRDGDTERPDDPAYAGSYFINANSATAPGIVDADCNPILTRSEVYSGVYGRASINFYAFNSNGNKGIEDIRIELKEDRIAFPWFKELPSPEDVKAYSHFIASLCEMALNQKRITAKEKPVDNDKYAFRCFLLRLGFIGEDYKTERKILLRNLSGSSAFKSGAKKTEVETCE